MSFGPFDISADRVQALGTRFTPFVNRLLELEVAANAMRGWQLSINSNETTPDGGVDAALQAASETDYLPGASQSFSMIHRRISLSPLPAAPVNSGEPLNTIARREPPCSGVFIFEIMCWRNKKLPSLIRGRPAP
jgi:hypothetical protein